MPITWVLGMFLLAFFLKDLRIKKRLFISSFLLLVFFTNEFLVNEALLLWEHPAKPLNEIKVYNLGIVLTGVTDSHKKPRDRVYFYKGADRVLHTLQLYKSGKIKKILISGGSGIVIGPKYSESEELKKVFVLCGVNPADIFLENQSRNTRENAVYTVNKITKENLSTEALLITSAFHMKRAAACFEKAGMKPDLFSVDFYTFERKYTPNILLLPSEGAMAKWGLLVHEIVGFLTYKVLGYC